MRELKLKDHTRTKLLDELDALDGAERGGAAVRRDPDFFRYRVPDLRVDFDLSRNETVTLAVPSRRLGPVGVYFLASSLVHSNCPCRVHLVTVRENLQVVTGKVATCRYLPGDERRARDFRAFRPSD